MYKRQGLGLADGSHNHVADVAELTLGTTQYPDGLNLFGAGIIGHLQVGLLLNHNGTSLLRFFDDLDDAPPLVLGQGAGLHDLDAVANATLVVLIMGLQLIGSLDDLLVQRMGHAVGDGDHDGLIHLVRNHQADSGLTDRKSTRLNSSHSRASRMPSSA